MPGVFALMTLGTSLIFLYQINKIFDGGLFDDEGGRENGDFSQFFGHNSSLGLERDLGFLRG